MHLHVWDGHKTHAQLEEDGDAAWARFVVQKKTLALRAGIRLLGPEAVSMEAPLPACVHWNRWIVGCPDCPNAELVWIAHPLMMCTNCWNGAHAHMWRRVQIPDSWFAIERALMARPVPETRNWFPGETVLDLHAENAAHNVRA